MVCFLHFLRLLQQSWALSRFLGLLEALLRFSPVLEYSFPSEDFPHLSGISWKGALVRQVELSVLGQEPDLQR